jgi:hypothetical protein
MEEFMFKLKMKIGKGMLEIENADIKKLHKVSAVYGMLPEKCDCCQSDNLHLSFKSPKGNDYYSIRCKECGAELNLHQKKEGGAFYVVADEKMTVYSGSSNNDSGQQSANEEDIPF